MCINRSVTMAIWSCFFLFFVIGSTSAKSVTIENVTLSSDNSITSEDLLKNVTKSFVEYDKNLDEYINWVDFDNMFKEIMDHDGAFSIWSIGEVRKFFMKSKDDYFYAVSSIYGWCGQVQILMMAYLELFNEYKPEVRETQKQIIVGLLDEGITKMTDALNHLDNSKDNLNTGVVELTNLIGNISSIFARDESEHEERLNELNQSALKGLQQNIIGGIINLILVEAKYKPECKANFKKVKSSFDFMKTKLIESIDKALEIKQKLLAEIQNVVELQAAAKSNRILIPHSNILRAIKITASALITKCVAYQDKHRIKVCL